ncbi:E3 ubiquitin-protein ligase CIP8-like [Miscanthus floridulus]|uniref:E3 ubiquitin-protein ligase CIP8-like n=1 Tax=Miscanthus floridulus TaxID=154761 RepID=UPI0034578C52
MTTRSSKASSRAASGGSCSRQSLDDEFEILPGHVVEVGGAPPAVRAAVERLQVVAVRGEEAAQGCSMCKEGMEQGELATGLSCGHFYHGASGWRER